MRSWLAVTGQISVVGHNRSHQGFYIALEPGTKRLLSAAHNSDDVQIQYLRVAQGDLDLAIKIINARAQTAMTHPAREVTFFTFKRPESICAEVRRPIARFRRTIINQSPAR